MTKQNVLKLNLEKRQLQPQLILLSVIFFPFILALLIASIIKPEKPIIIVLVCLFALYVVLTLVLWLLSMRKDKYLTIGDDETTIRYPNVSNANIIKITNSNITRIEYYKLSTIKNWLTLFNFVLPQCVYITYKDENDEERDAFIGYLNVEEVKILSQRLNANLIIH